MTIGSIVIQVADVAKAMAFWAPALEYEPAYAPEADWVILRPRNGRSGPNLSLDGVGANPAPFPEIHLDLYAVDQAAEIERLIGLGARRVEDWPYPDDEPVDFVVLEDPDGHRFCVIDTNT